MIIKLQNGSQIQVEEGLNSYDVAKIISEDLARNAVCASVNGKLVDLSDKLSDGDELRIITLRDPEGLDVYRHTASHVLAQAIKTIYPTCNLAIRAFTTI